MDRFFQITAVILAGVAAYFLWQGNADRAFVAAVFGAVSFFLSVRVQVKRRLNEREAARVEEEQRSSEAEEAEPEKFDEVDDDEAFDSEAPALNEMPAGEQINNERRTTRKEPKI